MTSIQNTVYAGIKGTVIAMDRSTGTELWRARLTGSGFVNLTLDGNQLIATTRGEIFCLDSASGAMLWTSDLPGMGQGIITVVTSQSPNSPTGPSRELIRQNEEAAVTAASAAVIAST